MGTENPSLINAQINKKEFVLSVQIDPPIESKFGELMESVLELRDNGITIFDVNGSRRDCMSAYDVASRLSDMSDIGLETIPHVTARDAALEPILTQILDGYRRDHSIKNVLIITGDPYNPIEGKPDSRNIFQTKSVGIIASLDRELRQTGRTPDLIIAAAVNPNAENLVREEWRLKAKEQQGTNLFMSQPVFDPEQAKKGYDFFKKNSDKPLLAGIWPFASIKTVENIHNGKIKGVVMPESIYEQAMRYKDDPDGLKEWSFEQTRQTVNTIKKEGLAQGIYIVAPLRNPAQLVDFVKSLNR